MRYIKWIGLAAAALLIISCFMPWAIIVSQHVTIRGVDGSISNYGKPGYFNLLMSAIFLVFHFIPRVWAKRANLVVVALNIAWAIRNLLILSVCPGGECLDKKPGLYLMVMASVLLLIAALFPNMKLEDKKSN